MFDKEILEHKDAKQIKLDLKNKIDPGGYHLIDLSRVKRASLSCVQVFISFAESMKDEQVKFKISNELKEIISDLGMTDLFMEEEEA